MNTKQIHKNKIKISTLAGISVIVISTIGLTGCGSKIVQTSDTMTLELGSEFEFIPADFFKASEDTLSKLDVDTSKADPTTLGTSEITVSYESNTYTITLNVVDTTSPVVTPVDDITSVRPNETITASDYVNVEDMSDYIVYFLTDEEEPITGEDTEDKEDTEGQLNSSEDSKDKEDSKTSNSNSEDQEDSSEKETSKEDIEDTKSKLSQTLVVNPAKIESNAYPVKIVAVDISNNTSSPISLSIPINTSISLQGCTYDASTNTYHITEEVAGELSARYPEIMGKVTVNADLENAFYDYIFGKNMETEIDWGVMDIIMKAFDGVEPEDFLSDAGLYKKPSTSEKKDTASQPAQTKPAQSQPAETQAPTQPAPTQSNPLEDSSSGMMSGDDLDAWLRENGNYGEEIGTDHMDWNDYGDVGIH